MNGLRIDLDIGNKWHVLFENEDVFEPKPNIGKFKIFLHALFCVALHPVLIKLRLIGQMFLQKE